jgi:hypothetical protein
MARDVSITVPVVPAVLPEGIAEGLMQISITDTATPPNVIATQSVAALTALFTGIANGSYMAVAQDLDTTGAPLGTPVSQAFTVADLLFNQPVGPLTITVT